MTECSTRRLLRCILAYNIHTKFRGNQLTGSKAERDLGLDSESTVISNVYFPYFALLHFRKESQLKTHSRSTKNLLLFFGFLSSFNIGLYFFLFAFMGPCILNVFKNNQQDVALHNDIYYCKWSTCFRQFLHPSSGAQNCIHSIGHLSSSYCFLPLAHASGKKQ